MGQIQIAASKRAALLAALLIRVAELEKNLDKEDHDAPLRLTCCMLEIACLRGSGEHDLADAAVARLRKDPALERMWLMRTKWRPTVSGCLLLDALWPPPPPGGPMPGPSGPGFQAPPGLHH